MEARDIDIEPRLAFAARLREAGDDGHALEIYKSVLVTMDKDDPRREDLETAIAFLQVSTTLAVEPEQLAAWRHFKGWVLAKRKGRWAVLGAMVLLELALFVSQRTNFDAKSNVVAVLPSVTSVPIPAEFPGTPMIELAQAPTPLAVMPSETLAPTALPSPTATLLPSLTPTPVPTSTPIPPIAAPAKSQNGGQGTTSGSSSTALPAPAPAPDPGPIPPPPPPSGGGSKGGGNGPGGGNGHGGGKGNGGGPGKHN